MLKTYLEKRTPILFRPFALIAKGVAGMCLNTLHFSSRLLGKSTAKAAQTFCRKDIKKIAAAYQNNTYIEKIVLALWLILLTLLSHKIYTLAQPNGFSLTAIRQNPMLAGLLILSVIAFILFLLDIARNISLVSQKRTNQKIAASLQNKNAEELKNLLLAQNLPLAEQERLKKELQKAAAPQNILAVYEKIILRPKDEKAEQIIKKYAAIASIAGVIPKKLSWDYLIMLLSYAKMLHEIAKIYEVKLSLSAFLKIFLFGLAVSALAVITVGGVKKLLPKSDFFALIGGLWGWLGYKLIECALPYTIITFLGATISQTLRPLPARHFFNE